MFVPAFFWDWASYVQTVTQLLHRLAALWVHDQADIAEDQRHLLDGIWLKIAEAIENPERSRTGMDGWVCGADTEQIRCQE